MTALPKPMKRSKEKRLEKAELAKDYLAACMAVDVRDVTCVVDRWSKVRCYSPEGKPDHDHIISLGRGGPYVDPNNIQLLCRVDHDLKHRLPHIANCLGLNGVKCVELEQLKFRFGNPNGEWDEYIQTLREIWDIEKRQTLGVTI